jgi:hypothetical protein
MSENKPSAVYMVWATFLASLDVLTEAMPTKIDKSVFPKQSGSVQAQLLAGLKFLALTTDDGKPTADLVALATADEKARKETLKRILEERYPALFDLDLTKTTSSLLYEKMAESYNVNGETREKAVRFFIAAAQYAGVPLGKYLLQAKAATGGVPRKRRSNGSARESAGAGAAAEVAPVPAPAPSGTGKTITLKSGHTLTVSTTAGVFDIGEDDRKFLGDLIDKLNAYARANEPAE